MVGATISVHWGDSVIYPPYSLGFDKERLSNYIDLLSVSFHLSEKA